MIVRQGSDLDRLKVILDSGEPGYSNDTNRLYIGNGILSGGNVVGNLFKGSAPTITDASLRPAVIGDTGYATDTKKLYQLKTGTGENITDWELIGGVYSAENGINITADNRLSITAISGNQISPTAAESPIVITNGKIKLTPLPANYISLDAVVSPITIDGGKIKLSPLPPNYISSDAVISPITIDSGKIKLSPLPPNYISPDAVVSPIALDPNGKLILLPLPPNYISSDVVSSPIKMDLNGKITLAPISANYISQDAISYPIELDQNGRITIQPSFKITAKYYTESDPLSVNNFSKLASISTIDIGRYRVTFNPSLSTINYVTHVQILGENVLDCNPRVTNISVSSCDISIINSSGYTFHSGICVSIEY